MVRRSMTVHNSGTNSPESDQWRNFLKVLNTSSLVGKVSVGLVPEYHHNREFYVQAH